jgi:26S proteasome regulatory subunit N9
MQVNVVAYLQAEKSSCPKDLTEFYSKFEDLYDKKLWHQLTMQVEEFVQKESSSVRLISLYQNFIADWQAKMNRISLVRFASRASRQLKGIFPLV